MATPRQHTSRRDLLARGALLGGALAPATLVSAAEAQDARAGSPAPGSFDVHAFGARGDGRADETEAIRGAIRACHAAGGGTVHVPAGRYLCRPFELLTNVTLDLEAGVHDPRLSRGSRTIRWRRATPAASRSAAAS